jgi:hypothetical protein
MPNWAQFREGIKAGLPKAELLKQLRILEGWQKLAPGEALSALNEELKNCAPALLYRSMVDLNLTIHREADIPAGAESGPALKQLFTEVQQGIASDERKKVAARLSVLWN